VSPSPEKLNKMNIIQKEYLKLPRGTVINIEFMKIWLSLKTKSSKISIIIIFL
jgi:hypothetical protein